MRTALLAAVGHDLRTPLASAKAAVTSLRSNDIDWSPQDRDELLATADESLDRLARLVDNLLDMSRLQAGALSSRQPTGRARRGRAPGPRRPRADAGRRVADRRARRPARRSTPTPACSSGCSPTWSPTRCATARRDARHSSPAAASATGSSCGSSTAARASRPTTGTGSSLPFQRLGDTDNTTGVGLGPGPVPRAHRGDGRHAGARGDPRRRPHHGGVAAARRHGHGPRAGPGASAERDEAATAHDARAGRRRRAADPAGPGHQPAGPPLRGAHRRHRRRGARRRPPRTRPTWSSSTSGCPTSTASR